MTHNKVTSNKLASLSSPAQYAQRAERFLHRHNYQAAVSDFSAAIEANPPELKQYLCRRSTAYLHFRDYTEAEEDANKCLKLDPNYAFAYIVKAEAESKQLKLKECLADAKNALELCKGNNALDQSLRVRADISCGYTYYRLGELAKAEQYYRAGGKEQEALTEVTSALNPGNTDHCYDRAFRLRALIYESLKNYDQASVDINKAARINSNLSSMQAEVKRIEYEKDNASKNHG